MQVTAPIEVIEADITTLAVDAIVNAANERMLGGGGVDGAIHRAAGRDLYEECRSVREVRPGVRCPTGEARITKGYRLPAPYVIHTVGPVWGGGGRREAELLRGCYEHSLRLAAERGLRSVAFPSISTGAYRYPLREAARIAIAAVRDHLAGSTSIELVRLVCFSEGDLAVYRELLAD